MLDLNRLYNMDCMEGMAEIPDGFFDLAIVDPPYGGCQNDAWKTAPRSRFGGRFYRYEIKSSRTDGSNISHWDEAPGPEYFKELFRVSKNQIIWGGNYFDLPPTRCFIVWRKLTISEGFSMSMCEYAWTSFNANSKYFEFAPQGNPNKKRFHPTQKPEELYLFCLRHFSNAGDKILDSHAGSGSALIAAQRLGNPWMGFELDTDYCRQSQDRINLETVRGANLFETQEAAEQQMMLF